MLRVGRICHDRGGQMSNVLITQLVAAVAIIASVGLFLRYVAVPAVAARDGVGQRVAAGLLSLYAFAVFAALGVGLGIGIIWAWPRIA